MGNVAVIFVPISMMSAARTRSGTTLHVMARVAVAVETHATPRGASVAGSVIQTSGTQSRLTQSAEVLSRTRHASTDMVLSSGVHLTIFVAVTSAWPRVVSAAKMRTDTILLAARTAHVVAMHVQEKEASAANLWDQFQDGTQSMRPLSALSECEARQAPWCRLTG